MDLKTQADLTQMELSEQIKGIQKFFEPEVVEGEDGDVDPGDNIVTYKQFQLLENKVDQLILLPRTNVYNGNEQSKAWFKLKNSRQLKRKLFRKNLQLIH